MKINEIKNLAYVLGAITIGLSSTTAFASSDETQTRDVDTFTGILVEGAMNLEVTVGEEQRVIITTDAGYNDRVETTVEDGVLVIDQKGRRWRDIDVEVTIEVPSLDSFIIEGAADADISGISSDSFTVRIDGAADITLEGECVKASYEVNGAGDINAKEFICEEVDIEINGAGDADVYASETITATLNGVGDITVYGDPSRIRPRINGLGSFDMK